jgi:hypothetical protein
LLVSRSDCIIFRRALLAIAPNDGDRILTVFVGLGAGCGFDLLIAMAIGFGAALGMEWYGDDLHRAFALKKHALQVLFREQADLFGALVQLDLCGCAECRDYGGEPASMCGIIFKLDILAICRIETLLSRFW